jgi:hypothetical protein
MCKASTLITLFISTFVLGQNRGLKRIPSLTYLEPISSQALVGDYYVSHGFWGYKIHLDSNMTFQKMEYGCSGSVILDSGLWVVKDQKTAVLRSSTKILPWAVIKFDNYYFLIQSSQRKTFIGDLEYMRQKYKNKRPVTIDNKTYTVDYIIGGNLMEKYFAREIDENGGT